METINLLVDYGWTFIKFGLVLVGSLFVLFLVYAVFASFFRAVIRTGKKQGTVTPIRPQKPQPMRPIGLKRTNREEDAND
jgi:hypothetical protein